MQKIISLVAVLISVALLCSCGNTKPKNTSDAMYQIGLNALQAADDYIAGKITGDEAYSKIEEYETQANAQYNKEIADAKSETLVSTEFSNDSYIMFDITSLSYRIMSAKHGTGAMSEVKEKREALAKDIGR